MIRIKKKITLESAGEEYKDSYLEFYAIPFKDFESLAKRADELAAEDDVNKTFGSLIFIREQLSERFIGGKIIDDDVKKEDLFDLPGDMIVDCFQTLMGKISPK